MGNTLAPMQQELALAQDVHAKDARETFERIEEMAQDRIDLFCHRIGHDDFVKHLIPVNKVVHKYSYIGVSTEEQPLCWAQEVSNAVEDFASGPIADGLSSIATSAITKMLGSSSGRRQMVERYAITLDYIGGISRLDYMIFTYTFASSAWSRKKVSLVACCVVESSAVIDDLDCNTLRVIISHAFKGGDVPLATLYAIYAQLVLVTKETLRVLSLTDEEKHYLEEWHRATNRKLLTNGSDHSGHPSPTLRTYTHQELSPEAEVECES